MEEDVKILENYLHTLKKFTGEEIIKSDEVIKFIEHKEIQALENLIKGYRELEEYIKRLDKLNARDFILKSEIQEKIEEQLNEANDVLENGNYLDNFNGNKNEQHYYYEGYKDATLFVQELMEE